MDTDTKIERGERGGLRGEAVRGASWNFAETFGRHGVSYIVTIYLARLLAPDDYGVIGIAAAFLVIALALIDGGFKTALVQKKEVTQIDYSTVFYVNVALALVIYTMLYFAAPHIAAFYREPILEQILRLIGLTFVANALTMVHVANLRRKMKFKTLALITIPAEITAGAVTVAMAYMGYGVMSLAAKIIISSFVSVALCLIVVRWRPSFAFSARSFGEIFGTGIKLLATTLASVLYINVSTLFIGRIFPVLQLGYYSFSNKILNATAYGVTTVVTHVSHAAFSKIQDDKERLTRWYEHTAQSTAAALFPFLTTLFIMAEPLIRIILNDNWLPAIPYLRWLCVICAVISIYEVGGNVIKIKNINLYLKMDGVVTLTLFALLFALVRRGIEVFLIGQAIHSVIALFAVDYCKSRYVNSPFLSTFVYLAPVALSTAAMGGGGYLMMKLFGGAEAVGILQCAIIIAASATIYCLCLRAFKVKVFMTAIQR